MSEVYNRKLGKLAHQVADDNNISLKDGVYAFLKAQCMKHQQKY